MTLPMLCVTAVIDDQLRVVCVVRGVNCLTHSELGARLCHHRIGSCTQWASRCAMATLPCTVPGQQVQFSKAGGRLLWASLCPGGLLPFLVSFSSLFPNPLLRPYQSFLPVPVLSSRGWPLRPYQGLVAACDSTVGLLRTGRPPNQRGASTSWLCRLSQTLGQRSGSGSFPARGGWRSLSRNTPAFFPPPLQKPALHHAPPSSASCCSCLAASSIAGTCRARHWSCLLSMDVSAYAPGR